MQEIGSDIDDRGDFDEVYDKIEDEGEAVVEEGEEEEKREEESITTQNLVEFAGRGRGEREISKFLFNHQSPDGKRNAAAKITLEYFECQNFNHLNIFLAAFLNTHLTSCF